jgi:hypothetical protein
MVLFNHPPRPVAASNILKGKTLRFGPRRAFRRSVKPQGRSIMTSTRIHTIFRQALCLACVPLVAGGFLVAQQPPPPAQGPAPLLAPQQLDTLVAPVALYPDRLLSQIMAASTYPLEIAEAAQWLQRNGNLQGPQLVDAARQQNWDPSVQALVVFPDVLNNLASDIRWTTDLGNAFLAQQADVMGAVQRMRAQASASGKLRSNGQQTVTTEQQGDQSAIDIQPANPEMVYVPTYNPEYIWGPPAYGYYPPWDYADIGYGLGYGFGPGIYIGGFFGGLGWGGWGWGFNWFHPGIFLNAGFFGRYGFGGRGFGAGGVWAHDASHRLGVAYPNRALGSRYGAASAASARSSFSASRYNSSARTGAAQSGGWNRFGSTGAARSTSANAGSNAYRGGSNAYRGGTSAYGGGSSAYRGSSSYGGNYGGSRATPSYRSSPSYGGGGGYRSSGSVHSYGGSVHSYGGSVHSSGGSAHYSGGGHSSGGGGHSSGGGGHSSGGGHGGGGHR